MSSLVESTTDVLIIGGGPSGLMAALWMARCGINARIIDARATKTFRGKADGLQPRTIEILASFGLASLITESGYRVHESTYWTGDGKGGIKRGMRVSEWSPELGRYHLTTSSQGRTERIMLDGMKRFNHLAVERGVKALGLELDSSTVDDPDAFPITVTVHHMTEEELLEASDHQVVPQPGDFNYEEEDEPYRIRRPSGREGSNEIIRAKYVIGTDGARSLVRNAIGANFEGDPRESVGGVLDCLIETDFPDKFSRTFILRDGQAAMIIPREGGTIRLGALFEEIDRSSITPEMILERIQHLIRPYRVDCKSYDWHGVFQSAQRRASKLSSADRIFLAGDALHTHSPRAGVGLNFSIQDTYNLGWKIAQVVKGLAKPSILRSYAEERDLVCEQLIHFDRKLARDFRNGEALSLEKIHDNFVKSFPFTSGTGIEYSDGLLVAKEMSKQHLAPGAVLGRRLLTKWVIGHGSGGPVDLEKHLPSDGRYKLLVFPGDVSDVHTLERVRRLSQALERPKSFIQKLTKRHFEPRSLLNVLFVHTAPRDSINITDLPPFLTKTLSSEPTAENVFVDNSELAHFQICDAYSGYGINRASGCMILLRPDRHVMYVGQMENVGDLEKIMSGVLAL